MEYPFDMDDMESSYHPEFQDQNQSDFSLVNGLSAFHLKSNILNCHSCPLAKYEKSEIFGNMSASIMVIVEKPEEIDFSTEKGQFLYNFLRHHQFNMDDIYFTPAVKCQDSNNFSKCHQHLISEVIIVNPLLIVAFGYNAGSQLFDHLQNAGAVNRLPTGSDIMATYSLDEIQTEVTKYNDANQHLNTCKNQWQYRVNERSLVHAR